MSNTTYKPKTSRLSYRIAAYALSLLSIITPVAPSLAAQLSNSAIEAQLALDPAYEWLNSFEYQYKTPTYIENSTLNASDIDAFYQDIENEHRAGLGDPIYVPISVGKVTTIIPTYPSYKYLGTTVVQSRYIRTQINALLGRTLIDSTNSNYATESAQLNTLYGNALTYIKSTPGLEFGNPLNRHQDGSGLAYDIVWPELRTINGQEVIVPVVYLSQATMEQHAVIEHETTFNGDVHVGSLTIDDVNIETGRNTFIQVADALTNGGSITSPGELKIVAGGALQNLSGKIQAEGDLVVGAHSIYSQTIVHRYDTAYDIGSRYGQVASFDSASGDVVLRSYSDINFLGSTASAGGELTLAADGNIYLGPEALQEGHRSRYENAGREATSYLQSELTAEDTIKLIASGQILIDAAEIASSEGHIELMAGMGISVQDVLASERNYKHGTYGKREIHEEAYQTVAVRSVLDAGKGIRLHTAMGDITLKGVDIASTEGAHVKADSGKVKMLMAVETDHYSYNETKESLFTVTSINRGHNIETAVPNTIIGGFQAEALYGLEVDYEGDPELSFDEQVNNLSQMPGLEWMEELRNSSELSDVNWTEVSLAYEQWHESSTTLSPAAMAIISIAVAVATQGVAAGWTETLLANTTFSATGALGTAMTAGFTSLVSQATLALANGAVAGDIAGAINDFLSEDTLKSLAVAMVTAAAINAVDTEFFNPSDADLALAEWSGGAVARDALLKTSLGEQVVQSVTHATVKAGINSIAYDSDFADGFRSALMADATASIGEYSAKQIAGAFDVPGASPFQTAMKYISHAAVGCVLGAATAAENDGDEESNCAAQGGGAVVGELIGSAFRNSEEVNAARQDVDEFVKNQGDQVTALLAVGHSREEILIILETQRSELYNKFLDLRQQGVNLAQLSAAFIAFSAGADAAAVNAAATGAENAAKNNALSFGDVAKFLSEAADEIHQLLTNPEGILEPLVIAAADEVIKIGVELSDVEEASRVLDGLLSFTGFPRSALESLNMDLTDPAIVAGFAAAVIDTFGVGAVLADMKLRSSLGATLLTDGESHIANFERIEKTVDETVALVTNLDQVAAAVATTFEDAVVDGDPMAKAQVARLLGGVVIGCALGTITVGVSTVTGGLASTIGVPITAIRLQRTLSSIKDLADQGRVNLDRVLDSLPIKVKYADSPEGPKAEIESKEFNTSASNQIDQSIYHDSRGVTFDSESNYVGSHGFRIPDGDPEEYITIYRGIRADHPDYENAVDGKTVPIGGHSDPTRHNRGDKDLGDLNSNFTSWSLDRATAVAHGSTSPGAFVLEMRVKRKDLVWSPDSHNEKEVLTNGPTSGGRLTHPDEWDYDWDYE